MSLIASILCLIYLALLAIVNFVFWKGKFNSMNVRSEMQTEWEARKNVFHY
jgi:hypothetical protein